ncbi:MAG: hypothetical protein ATN36_03885 [Epulopiscium sp. Nele67-Bin005]|nr:MAG: hypothetical protein ATN36_03885 [Epulopiscium sp. Nele67-Bin005]
MGNNYEKVIADIITSSLKQQTEAGSQKHDIEHQLKSLLNQPAPPVIDSMTFEEKQPCNCCGTTYKEEIKQQAELEQTLVSDEEMDFINKVEAKLKEIQDALNESIERSKAFKATQLEKEATILHESMIKAKLEQATELANQVNSVNSGVLKRTPIMCKSKDELTNKFSNKFSFEPGVIIEETETENTIENPITQNTKEKASLKDSLAKKFKKETKEVQSDLTDIKEDITEDLTDIKEDITEEITDIKEDLTAKLLKTNNIEETETITEIEKQRFKIRDLFKKSYAINPFHRDVEPIEWVETSIGELKQILNLSNSWEEQLRGAFSQEELELVILGKDKEIEQYYIGIGSKYVNADDILKIEYLERFKPHHAKAPSQGEAGYWVGTIL